MRLLLVSATRLEIMPFLNELGIIEDFDLFALGRYKNCDVDVLLTGVGMTQTAFYLGKYLRTDYDVIINAGICGSFDKAIPLGTVVRIEEDCFADLGAENGDEFLSVKEMDLLATFHIKNENPLSNSYIDSLPSVKGATVNKVHGNESSINKFKQYNQAKVESMEGAAFLWACNQSKVKSIQLRAVSNYVELRNRNAWNVPLAVEHLNKALLQCLESP